MENDRPLEGDEARARRNRRRFRRARPARPDDAFARDEDAALDPFERVGPDAE